MPKCKTCNENKPLLPDYFETYKRKGEVRYYGSCRLCQKKKANKRHHKRMLDPKKRKEHNTKIKRAKKRKYRRKSTFREKCQQESRVAYLIDGEGIKDHMRRRYALDPKYREAAKQKSRQAYSDPTKTTK